MTLKDYEIESEDYRNNLGLLSLSTTRDGTTTLRSTLFKESFHDASGAKRESIEKFLLPAELDRFTTKDKIKILDVCVGMGYNSGILIDSLINKNIPFDIWGLEIDRRPLDIAIKDQSFTCIWSAEIINILNSLSSLGKWDSEIGSGQLLWGDARESMRCLTKENDFDLILLDAFSPYKCPELWTNEFLYLLTKKLSSRGRLITYSSSAAIRNSLRKAGMVLRSIKPLDQKRKVWSVGTVAMSPNAESLTQNELLKELSKMEEEHLLTRAAIPYRDPSGKSSRSEILDRRNEEQIRSCLESTSEWKRRWNKQT